MEWARGGHPPTPCEERSTQPSKQWNVLHQTPHTPLTQVAGFHTRKTAKETKHPASFRSKQTLRGSHEVGLLTSQVLVDVLEPTPPPTLPTTPSRSLNSLCFQSYHPPYTSLWGSPSSKHEAWAHNWDPGNPSDLIWYLSPYPPLTSSLLPFPQAP